MTINSLLEPYLFAVTLADDFAIQVGTADVNWGTMRLDCAIFRRRNGELYVELPVYEDGLCYIELDASDEDRAALVREILREYKEWEEAEVANGYSIWWEKLIDKYSCRHNKTER